MDDAVDDINVEDNEVTVLNALKRYVFKEFDLNKDGSIKKTAKNLRAAQKIKKLRSIVVNDAYKAKVGEFVGKFNTVKSLSDQYITDL